MLIFYISLNSGHNQKYSHVNFDKIGRFIYLGKRTAWDMPLKEYQSTSYPDLKELLENITQTDDAEIFIFFSCTLDKHGDPTTKACFESEDSLMEYTEFIRGS